MKSNIQYANLRDFMYGFYTPGFYLITAKIATQQPKKNYPFSNTYLQLHVKINIRVLPYLVEIFNYRISTKARNTPRLSKCIQAHQLTPSLLKSR